MDGKYSDDPFGSIANIATVMGLVGTLAGLLMGRRGEALAEWGLIAAVFGGGLAALFLLADALHLVDL